MTCDPALVQRESYALRMIEYQLVRMDGRVLIAFTGTTQSPVWWEPPPCEEIFGACAGRYRIENDGWTVVAYYPDGFPGPQAPWPQGILISGESR